MKAERRHQLKTNALDRVLTAPSDTSRKYAGMLLLVVLVAGAAYLLVRYRISATREAEQATRENLTAARMTISQLGQLDLFPLPASEKSEYRTRWADEARRLIDQVMQSADDPALLAEALLAKGDLNWALAQLNEPAEAATRPSLRFESPAALLSEAEAAYEQVRSQYAQHHGAVLAARFGLAAVHENLGQWDKAVAHYQAIIDDDKAAESFKTQARVRLDKAADWRRPVLLVASTQAAVQAAVESPATAPVAPATQAAANPPAAPTTVPATTPTTAP